jgi:PRTRC genetic system protein C
MTSTNTPKTGTSTSATRVFIIEKREAPDPDRNKTVDEVRQYYATFFPELSNAETKDLGTRKVEGSEEVEHLWEFVKRVGSKGAHGKS